MENCNDMMMVKHEIKQNFGAFSHGRKTYKKNSMDTALNKIDCIFAVFLTCMRG